MIEIEVYAYGQCFIALNQSDRDLVCHLTGGCAAFQKEQQDKITYLAAAHNWKIKVVPKPEKE